jgi:hypothetical protein
VEQERLSEKLLQGSTKEKALTKAISLLPRLQKEKEN